MKRFILKSVSVILVLSMLLAFMPQFNANAATYGDFEYIIFHESYESFAVISGYTGAGGSITIPSTIGGYPVRHIHINAFEDCLSITNVTLPNGLIGIQAFAFKGCENLQSINIPDGTILIGEEAFRDCQSLTSISIPSSVFNIGYFAFYRCKLLASINVSASNSYYSSLDGVLINKNKTKLIVCPAGKSGSFTVPASVTSIDTYAFYFCKFLTDIEVEAANPNYSSFGGALYNKSQTTLRVCPAGKTGTFSLPDSVTGIMYNALENCDKLTHIEVGAGNATYSDIDGVLCDKSVATLIACPCGRTGDYSIPNGVVYIADNAFFNCNELTSIYMPSSVNSIGYNHFMNCDNVASIEVSGSNFFYSSFDGVLFNKGKTILICCPKDKRGAWTVPDGVETIGRYAFGSCDFLTSVTIPSGVTSIEDRAFSDCDLLESVIIPNSVSNIGVEAFEDCNNLTIYGYANSSAQAYAANNYIPFVTIDNTSTVSFDSNGGSAVPSITIGTEHLTVTTCEDSYVRSRSKYVNTALGIGDYANSLNITWKSNDNVEWEGWIYLKFNVSGVGGGHVDAAVLNLTVHGIQNNLENDVQFNVYKVSPTWSENTLTWTNKPDPDTSKSYGVLKARGRYYDRNQELYINLDTSLFTNGDGVYSVALVVDKYRTPFGNDAAYWSKDQTVSAEYAPSISLTVADSRKIAAPTPPTREGYRFGGWYKDEACTDDWDFENDEVVTDITLYAKWTKVDITMAGVVINKDSQLVYMDVDFYLNVRSAGLFVYDASGNPIPPSYVKSSEGSYYTVSDFINARSATAEGTNVKAFDVLLEHPEYKRQNLDIHAVTYDEGSGAFTIQ